MKAKTLSDSHVLYHGDELLVASHKFTLHIHPRQETCAQCEPGCCVIPATNITAGLNLGFISLFLFYSLFFSSVPLVSRSSSTSLGLIRLWMTVEFSGPVWPHYRGTETIEQANCVKRGSRSVESDIAPLGIGLAAAYHRAQS